jgi:apolipoprotein N-acyltransferase
MTARLRSWASRAGALTGWRRNALAFFAGILMTLALPPIFALPLLLPSFMILYWLIDRAPTSRRAFADGWWWGFGHHMTALYWFTIALMTDMEKFGWLIPFALFGLTGIIALHNALACWASVRLAPRGLVRVLIFPVIWLAVEWLRGHWFSGFPWNLAGYAFAVSDVLLQPASLVGIYVLTWLAVALATTPAALGDEKMPRWKSAAAIFVIYGVFVAAVGWSAGRLQAAGESSNVPGVMLRLVQANIAQHHKWDPGQQMEGMKEHIRLTQMPGIEEVTHVVWPETAVPYAVEPGTMLTQLLGESVPEGVLLITGALRSQGDRQSDDWQIWNSIMAFNNEGSIVGVYDKVKLVPFGEFLPFRSVIPPSWLTPVGMKDFASGKGIYTLEWLGLPPMSPLVCYEAIFPQRAIDPKHRPSLLLNLTNDAWFGVSSGPYQHFHMARTRAVEQGIPLVRVANTGITAVIDSYGRIRAKLPLDSRGILDAPLPVARPVATVYGTYGDAGVSLLIFMAIVLIAGRNKVEKVNKFRLQVVAN